MMSCCGPSYTQIDDANEKLALLNRLEVEIAVLSGSTRVLEAAQLPFKEFVANEETMAVLTYKRASLVQRNLTSRSKLSLETNGIVVDLEGVPDEALFVEYLKDNRKTPMVVVAERNRAAWQALAEKASDNFRIVEDLDLQSVLKFIVDHQ